MTNKIKFIINSIIIIFLIITAIYLISKGTNTDFNINIELLKVVVIIYLLIHFAYCTIIRLIYNRIMTKYNNDTISNKEVLEALNKIRKLYLPTRIKLELNKSIEIIDRLKTIDEGISNIKI